jgi:ADP-heptose:LPS heptosyltransferase
MATLIKEQLPDAHIGFLGKDYTRAVVDCCSAVDEFVEVGDFLNSSDKFAWDTIIHVFPRKDIAWKALRMGIPNRIGTANRLYHLLTCNRLVKLSRRNSDLHEAQLNAKLLAPLGLNTDFSKEELGGKFSFDRIAILKDEFRELLQPGKRHIILHPKSQGSAREWGLDHFAALVKLLPKERFQIFISGTKGERALLDPLLEDAGGMVTDITGRMDLASFIAFINACDGLVAASTGPLHIAAACGKKAVGIYPPIRPMHPGRWAPLGPFASALALPKDCSECRSNPQECTCIQQINAAEVAALLQ